MGCSQSATIGIQSESEIFPGSTHTSQETIPNRNKRVEKLPALERVSLNNVREHHQRFSLCSPTPGESHQTRIQLQNFDELNHFEYTFINVLLLGESGVGKSTFINAIVNYLKFDTIEQACSGQPIVLMPVSFLLTVGDNFEERIIRFGNEDPNEDHHHPGQSVTQHCRSYVFTIGTRTKIRLIDTPGMGDTRGSDQDNLNMQHILSFINNLSHLNAICILLKPNESRLNVVFRSYFSQLTDFLGENIRNNIIFCFTNTRGTFFTPGNTAPLLKEILGKFSIKNIPFKKSNTFCFDSESFRYLIAIQNGINFDDYQKEEYKESWINSVNESNRFLGYICGALKTYPSDEWKSINHAQFQINQMIRPILETIRNLFRNLILYEEKSSTQLIKLCPSVVAHSSTICIKCNRVPKDYNEFWIYPDDLHTFSNKCLNCRCSRNRHIDINYKLDYELSNNVNKQFIDEIKLKSDQLNQAIFEFGCFFVDTSRTLKTNDLILSFLNQMIEEENQICQLKTNNNLNLILYKQLNQFKEEYEQRQNVSISNKNSINLNKIYILSQNISRIDLIEKQIDVIKQYHRTYMNEQEKQLL
ncbi:unnamed protein product [Rotaria sordida]|uniref:G domain-containing protein n=1 Tax=Rotaria sordida TaxID=392033 RepID=A0A819VJ55_9BILA|nr:unnamed protein product [Rotaria sordida]CAF4109866.1 unnamed protein product [Rotaria sordida]